MDNDSASATQLRTILATVDLKLLGVDTQLQDIPKDVLVSAARAGAATNVELLDILDGSNFVRSACLCCFEAVSATAARESASVLRVFGKYYDGASYVTSRAYVRAVSDLLRDLRPEAVAEVKQYTSRLISTPPDIKKINELVPGLCVAAPVCCPTSLWIYSTLEGRRLLRHLARGVRKKKEGAVRVVVATTDPSAHPRFRYRMYVASYATHHAPLDRGPLIEAALEWAVTNEVPSSGRPPRTPAQSKSGTPRVDA